MEEKGYVVCLLKYILGANDGDSTYWDDVSENKKPVALGYFGRVDVVALSRFKEYMSIASTYNAKFTGSRKQLLLYPLFTGEQCQICWQAFDPADGQRLPFQPARDHRRPCFCCLSILNISQSMKEAVCGTDYAAGIREIARCLSEQLEKYLKNSGPSAWMPFAIMGLLGTEDLCLISLSNDFGVICKAVSHLRSLTISSGGEFIIGNSHSIQMVDFSDKAMQPQWGETPAEIHFSLKTNNGMAYLEKVRDAIIAHYPGQDVCLESQIGEYDAVIRCPAETLGSYLYGYGQALNYNNPEYRRSAYQSETLLYQKSSSTPVDRNPVELAGMPRIWKPDAPYSGEKISYEIGTWMEQPLQEINRCIQKGASGNEHISQVLYRLLKDFMRIASIPFGGSFQQDMCVQFRAAINAVVCAAQQYQKLSKKDAGDARRRFDSIFPQIINALSGSMKAASQIDRLYFEEQQSHLQNTGAYHKVLLAYYGIVKVLLRFVYSISRKNGSGQPVLIPLLSFDHAQIVCSRAFDTTYEGKPARLLCITLPYQALSNVPKYIGPLAHEIFHYSTPADRAAKNDAAGKCLTAVAFKYFLDQVGAVSKCGGQAGAILFNEYRTEFLDTTAELFENIMQNLVQQYPTDLLLIPPGGDIRSAISSEAFFQCIRKALSPPLRKDGGNPIEQLYCEGWLELRKRLKKVAKDDSRMKALAVLDKNWDDDKLRKHIQGIYQSCLSQIACEIPAHLGVYEMALREVPPDLFDIALVLWNMPDEERTKQYLWQIHSIRSDKLYYSDCLEGGFSKPMIEGNNIRFGIVLDYLAFGLIDNSSIAKLGARKKQISYKLQQWSNAEGLSDHQKAEWKKNCRAILSDYGKYFEDSLFVNVLFKDYIQQITDQLRNLFDQESIKPDLEKLSGFYREYCEDRNVLLDAERDAKLMDLALHIIEFYQCQLKLSKLSGLCGSASPLKNSQAPVAYADSIYDAQKCEVMVFGPEELSAKIVEVYEAMHLKNPTSPLWFRGQRLETWSLLPNIMREGRADGFQPGIRKMMTLAKAKILPQGAGFHGAEWLALLQHYSFKTSLLDWSEDLHSALFFAIQRWIEDLRKAEEGNASISVLNPILYNLVRDVLDNERAADDQIANGSYKSAVNQLKAYLESGTNEGMEHTIPLFAIGEDCEGYQCYFDLNSKDKTPIHLPIAAMTPASNDRMKRQAGVFTFCDIRTKPKMTEDGQYTYETYNLTDIQSRYFKSARQIGIKNPSPFLYKLILSSDNAEQFVRYVRAIGMRKYRMYPELNHLAGDIMSQSL